MAFTYEECVIWSIKFTDSSTEPTLWFLREIKKDAIVGAATAHWSHLCLPSSGRGFKSQAHHLRFFQFVLLKLLWEKDENKQKETGIFKNKDAIETRISRIFYTYTNQ